MLVDTHIHLQDNKYADDVDAVLQQAADAGVKAVVVPGTTLEDSQQAIKLAERYSKSPCQVYAAIGIHPTESHRLNSSSIEEIHKLAHHERVVAIGEIGLDYYWPTVKNRDWYCAEPATQRQAFELQLAIASDLNLPVIVHDREAHENTLSMLSAWHISDRSNRGVLHSYSLGIEQLKRMVDLGFFISISGPVTYKNAHEIRRVAEFAPDDILLLETDGPYLAPEPYRGRRNEPRYLPLIAQRVAELRGITFTTLAALSTRNAKSLFHINSHPHEP